HAAVVATRAQLPANDNICGAPSPAEGTRSLLLGQPGPLHIACTHTPGLVGTDRREAHYLKVIEVLSFVDVALLGRGTPTKKQKRTCSDWGRAELRHAA